MDKMTGHKHQWRIMGYLDTVGVLVWACDGCGGAWSGTLWAPCPEHEGR